MRILVFDIWGSYGHFKKYYATTTALTYAIPPKTTIYGILGALIGLSKFNNAYLETFFDKKCLIGLQLRHPIQTKRMGTNLRANRKRFKDNPKPTLVEYVYNPKYRIFVHHKDNSFMDRLEETLKNHTCVFTPTLGLANMLADFAWVGEDVATHQVNNIPISIQSIIPIKQFVKFGNIKAANIIEQTMFAVEMDTQRNVTERDDFLMDRNNQPIVAQVTHYYNLPKYGNVALF